MMPNTAIKDCAFASALLPSGWIAFAATAAIRISVAISSKALLMGSAPLRVDDAGRVARNGSRPAPAEARP